MKNKTHPSPTRSKLSVLRPLCNLIPPHLVPKLARDTGAAAKARPFSPWSQVVSLLLAQRTPALGLNDGCDRWRLYWGRLSALRGATPPSRHTLSHANPKRPAARAEQLFWPTLDHLRRPSPGFAAGGSGKRLAPRCKAAISVVDSTPLQLIASGRDGAKPRRRQAAAQCHWRLDLHSHRPLFGLIDPARDHDAQRAREVCAGWRAGEIVLFDKAYVDFAHLYPLEPRGVWRVTRAKDNLPYRVVKRPLKKPDGKILRDDEIGLTGTVSHGRYRGDGAGGGGVGGRRRGGAGEGVSDQQLCLGRQQRGGTPPVARANPSGLQADPTDVAVGRLLGQQRPRRARASVDGVAGLMALLV